MSRIVLSEQNIHTAIQASIGGGYQDTVEEVIQAINQNTVVVVGMAQNPFVKKARKLLEQNGIEFKYLEYGSYFSQWRRRTAIKMCTGWATFPQVFVGGQLVGGFADTKRLLESGELKSLLAPVTGANI